MGRFTPLHEPFVDQTIEGHLQYIVNSIVSRMEPIAIILRGSFGRGEGSVLIQDNRLRFLSDYEIDVATFSPFYRSLFARLTHQLTAELGVGVGIRWVRPDYLSVRRIGPLLVGTEPISISSYESRYGSRILYGQDIISASSAIDPDQIPLVSGILLMLNRMAESLKYMNNGSTNDDLLAYYWINKTILACIESLLILWKQFHFSYKERGLRFASLANQHLNFMLDQKDLFIEFTARATEFKLNPRRELYPLPINETWQQVVPFAISIIRHLVEQDLDIKCQSMVEFPAQYIQKTMVRKSRVSLKIFYYIKLLEVYRSLRRHIVPRSLIIPFPAYQVVYSVVPLLFYSYGSEKRSALLRETRYWLSKLGPLTRPSSDPDIEWDYLRKKLVRYWYIYCHG